MFNEKILTRDHRDSCRIAISLLDRRCLRIKCLNYTDDGPHYYCVCRIRCVVIKIYTRIIQYLQHRIIIKEYYKL